MHPSVVRPQPPSRRPLMSVLTAACLIGGLVLAPGLGHSQTEGPQPGGMQALQDRGIEAALAAAPAEGFERGALMVLRAVERALQTGRRHGLTDRLAGLPGLPFAPRRGRPRGTEPPAPDTVSNLIRTLLDDLSAARAVLEADPAPAPFVIDLQAVWLDVNANGARDAGEGAVEALRPLLLGRAARRAEAAEMPSIEVRFDAADRDWLMAYTHMVSGAGSLVLAFDPTEVLRDLAARATLLDSLPVVPEYYDLDALRARLPGLEAQVKDTRDRMGALAEAMKPYQARQRELSNRLRANPTPAERLELEAAQAALNDDLAPLLDEDRRLSRERRAAAEEVQSVKRLLGQPAIGDRPPRDDFARLARDPMTFLYVALTALRQQPDAARLHDARDHWLAMIAANRRFWAAVERETDSDREWIPNPRQQSALPVAVDPGAGPAWQRVLDEAEAVLQGRLLIGHPLLPPGTGINLAAWLDAPAPLDLAGWIHGVAAYPYAARGPVISGINWGRFAQLAGGRGGTFALWFN